MVEEELRLSEIFWPKRATAKSKHKIKEILSSHEFDAASYCSFYTIYKNNTRECCGRSMRRECGETDKVAGAADNSNGSEGSDTSCGSVR